MTRASSIISDPIPYSAPFLSPWKRPLGDDVEHRLMAWFAELVPGVAVEISEWVGADPRYPLHAVVVSFPQGFRTPFVLDLKVEEVERQHLVHALETEEGAWASTG